MTLQGRKDVQEMYPVSKVARHALRFQPVAYCQPQALRHREELEFRTAISKSTIFSAKVDISFAKQNLYSPSSLTVKTKSPCLSFVPSRMIFWVGPVTL